MGTGRMGHPQVRPRERRGSGNVQFVCGVEGTLERRKKLETNFVVLSLSLRVPE